METKDDLLLRLCLGTDGFPVTPEDAAALIVNELLADLAPDRKKHVRHVIKEWATDYADFSAGIGADYRAND